MPDPENEGVDQQDQATALATDQQQEQEPQEAAKKKQNSAEYNWAESRRVMQEQSRKIRDLEDQVNQFRPKKEVVEDELSKLAKDDLLSLEQAEKLINRKAAEIAESVIRQREALTVEDRLTSKFSDFTDVVNKETIDFLKETEPELALSLYSLKDDPYQQGIAAYKLMKKMGIAPSKPTDTPEHKKAVANSQKPVSVNAATRSSAIGNAHMFENGLTKELKAQLAKEMADCARRA